LEEPEPQPAVVVWRLPLPFVFVVTGPQLAPELAAEVRPETGRFWATANVQLNTSTQAKSVAILLIVYLLVRGVLPLAGNGSDHDSWFLKIVGVVNWPYSNSGKSMRVPTEASAAAEICGHSNVSEIVLCDVRTLGDDYDFAESARRPPREFQPPTATGPAWREAE
jgi:hypothetical protein